MGGNCIKQVRPGARFDTLEHYSDEIANITMRFERLADAIIKKESDITSKPHPFDHGQMLIVWGGPGRGKTHLIEAVINEITEKSPKILDYIFLSRSDFTLDNIAFAYNYENKPIIILDDFFSRYQSINDLNDATDIKCFMKFVQMVYEERRLVIITCNFPFKDGILQKVAQIDEIGRVTSRMKELMANSGEINIIGKDYRNELGKNNKGLIVF